VSLLSRLMGAVDSGYMPYSHRSPEGLCARWVQWGAASNIAWNPIADKTGARASAKQPDDVWFLAGCFGGSVTRTCTVPANKELFFPAFNIWASAKHQLPDPSKISGYLHIDGEDITLERTYTDQPFIVKGAWGNPVTESIMSKNMFVGGLWKLVPPLAPGEHDIRFGGSNGEGFSIDVTYKLTVNTEY